MDNRGRARIWDDEDKVSRYPLHLDESSNPPPSRGRNRRKRAKTQHESADQDSYLWSKDDKKGDDDEGTSDFYEEKEYKHEYYKEEDVWKSFDPPTSVVPPEKLKHLPDPEPLPIMPKTANCKWSFDESTRVLYGIFDINSEILRDDEVFLYDMMGRNDIVVVTEGISGIDRNEIAHADAPRTNGETRTEINVNPFEPSGTIVFDKQAIDRAFRLKSITPRGKLCMTRAVSVGVHFFTGPASYSVMSGTTKKMDQRLQGMADYGFVCTNGDVEFVVLRRLPPRHKMEAIKIFESASVESELDETNDSNDLDESFEYLPEWPTTQTIEKYVQRGYCPSVFVLKAGQCVHINKGRLFCTRFPSDDELPSTDCHFVLREDTMNVTLDTPLQYTVIDWSWIFWGVTKNAVNREIVSMLECAEHRKKSKLPSSVHPECCLIHTAKNTCVDAVVGVNNGQSEYDLLVDREILNIETIKGFYPALNYIVKTQTVEARRLAKPEGIPNSHEDPSLSSFDPYDTGGFSCVTCGSELSNMYFHCDGCEKLLKQDFNICGPCHRNERFLINHRMTEGQLMISSFQHTSPKKKCKKTAKEKCTECHKCPCCSCTCHTSFSRNFRFLATNGMEAVVNDFSEIAEEDLPYGANEIEDRLRHVSTHFGGERD